MTGDIGVVSKLFGLDNVDDDTADIVGTIDIIAGGGRRRENDVLE